MTRILHSFLAVFIPVLAADALSAPKATTSGSAQQADERMLVRRERASPGDTVGAGAAQVADAAGRVLSDALHPAWCPPCPGLDRPANINILFDDGDEGEGVRGVLAQITQSSSRSLHACPVCESDWFWNQDVADDEVSKLEKTQEEAPEKRKAADANLKTRRSKNQQTKKNEQRGIADAVLKAKIESEKARSEAAHARGELTPQSWDGWTTEGASHGTTDWERGPKDWDDINGFSKKGIAWNKALLKVENALTILGEAKTALKKWKADNAVS